MSALRELAADYDRLLIKRPRHHRPDADGARRVRNLDTEPDQWKALASLLEETRGVIGITGWSIELAATVDIPEWDSQTIHIMLEEDAFLDEGGCTFLDGRQTELWLIES